MMYILFFKRVIDVFLSITILLILLPFLFLILVWICLDSSGSPFFIQERVGRNNNLFYLYKFRTMKDVPRDPSIKQTFLSDPEITRIGVFLRRYKIDEIPQLWNVFIGDMSLVGPRPALLSLYQKYSHLANERLKIRPGLTGLSQVNGNIYLSWEKRFLLDNEYVRKCSFQTDLFIVLKTINIVLFGEEKFLRK